MAFTVISRLVSTYSTVNVAQSNQRYSQRAFASMNFALGCKSPTASINYLFCYLHAYAPCIDTFFNTSYTAAVMLKSICR